MCGCFISQCVDQDTPQMDNHKIDTIESFTDQLFEKWFPDADVQSNQTLLVLDSVTNNSAIRLSWVDVAALRRITSPSGSSRPKAVTVGIWGATVVISGVSVGLRVGR